jgi:hypothetical protein
LEIQHRQSFSIIQFIETRSKGGKMRILAEVVLVAIILGGAVVFFRAIWKKMDQGDKKQSAGKRGGK